MGGGVEAGQVADLVTLLVDKTLVLAETRDGEAGCGLLETVRPSARDKPKPGSASGLRQCLRNDQSDKRSRRRGYPSYGLLDDELAGPRRCVPRDAARPEQKPSPLSMPWVSASAHQGHDQRASIGRKS